MKRNSIIVALFALVCLVAATNPDTVTNTVLQTFSAGLSTSQIYVPAANYESVAAAGSTVSDAQALSASAHVHRVTGADGVKGVKFAAPGVGSVEFILNTTAGALKVYGEAGSTCNGGATDAACTLLSGIAPHICYQTAALTYICS